MSERIKKIFQKKSKKLISFTTAGDPDLETSIKILDILNNNQVDMIDNKTALKHGEIFLKYLTETFPGCNPLAPGFMKEWKLSILLGHKVETEKHKCDAWDSEGNQIEYLSCLENNIEKKRKRDFAIDCMFSSPPDFKKKSLNFDFRK